MTLFDQHHPRPNLHQKRAEHQDQAESAKKASPSLHQKRSFHLRW